jgi:hypothetical protein
MPPGVGRRDEDCEFAVLPGHEHAFAQIVARTDRSVLVRMNGTT